MKFYSFSVAILSILVGFAGSTTNALAQVTYSPSLDKYVNQTTGGLWNSESSAQLDGMINSPTLAMQNQMLANAIMNDAIMRDNGIAKIRSGRATTRIIYSPQNSIAERMATNAKTPAEAKATREAITTVLTAFGNILKSKHLTPYDSSDGRALSFILSYLVLNGEDPGDERLIKMRTDAHNRALRDELYQGMSEADKQEQYESRAFRTMLAVKASQQSKNGDVAAAQSAKSYATNVLKELWTGDPANIVLVSGGDAGFADRGYVAIVSGKAATTFTRSNSILSVMQLAEGFKTSEQKIETLLSEFDAEVKRRGGATNDAAWVNAVSFALVYEVYTDGKVKLNQQQFNWVLKEMQKDVLSQSGYQALSNEDKQKYYEQVAIEGMMVVDYYQRTGGGTLEMTYKAEARLKEIFAPRKLEEYTLRPTGFVKN